jgi:hypothetical protein
MHLNESPWLFELRRKRPVAFLVDDMHTNVAIVGGGIAGVVTAYCILKHTNNATMYTGLSVQPSLKYALI